MANGPPRSGNFVILLKSYITYKLVVFSPVIVYDEKTDPSAPTSTARLIPLDRTSKADASSTSVSHTFIEFDSPKSARLNISGELLSGVEPKYKVDPNGGISAFPAVPLDLL